MAAPLQPFAALLRVPAVGQTTRPVRTPLDSASGPGYDPICDAAPAVHHVSACTQTGMISAAFWPMKRHYDWLPGFGAEATEWRSNWVNVNKPVVWEHAQGMSHAEQWLFALMQL